MVIKTFAIYVLAALGELDGTYAYWHWLKERGTPLLALVGIGALVFYAVIQTFQFVAKPAIAVTERRL